VLNRADATLRVLDAAALAQRESIPVVANPDEVAVLPDSSLAFVMSRSSQLLSVVDLRRGVLLSHLELGATPTDLLLKPDGGELYVLSPGIHGLQAINTRTHEVGDYMLLGSAPTRGILLRDAAGLYVSDTQAGRITPVDVINRRVARPIQAGQNPGASRFDPEERLLLVANEGSGDLAVIRVSTNSLLTMIPVGNHPREIAVKVF
jgi:YVTN family beta-propeller protein